MSGMLASSAFLLALFDAAEAKIDFIMPISHFLLEFFL